MNGIRAIPMMPHTKRYRLLFSIWGYSYSDSISDFDNIEELKEETKLLKKFYNDTPRPQKSEKYSGVYDFSDGRSFWGYIALDYEKEEVLEVYRDGARIYHENKKGGYIPEVLKGETLKIKDLMFRGEDEIPKDYKWDKGEYEGWLKYRWGDGKNAIDYVEPSKKERPGVDEIWEVYDETTDTYKKQKVRVVYVDWKDPLPKKEKGILYMRPNKEPVLFPGDFGYEDDLNMNEWSLAEEMAGDEYLNKIGKKNFDIEKPTTSSIAEIFGDKNPLLKLLDKE